MKTWRKVVILLVVVMLVTAVGAFAQTKKKGGKEKAVDLARQPQTKVPSNTDYWKIKPADYAAVAKKGWLFGVATRSLYLDYFLAMQKSVVQRCYEWGIEAVTADAMLDPQLQLDQIDRFVTMGVDAVILNAQDPVAILPAVKKLNQNGIPVVTLDIELPKEKADMHISFDNYLGGEHCGQAFVGMMKKRYGTEKGLVLEIMGDPRHIVTSQRSEGFHRVVDKYPNIKVIQKTGNWEPDKAYQITQDILIAEGDKLDAVYMHSDCMVGGVVQGIKGLGYEKPLDDPKRIYVLALDGFPESLKLMREARLDFISIQPVNYYGYLAVDWMVKILQGEKVPTSGMVDIKGEELWCPSKFLVSEYKTGPQLLTNSPLVGDRWGGIAVDDPRLWGNWLKQ
jgi:ribose transport system substrate-binding protein